MTGFAIENWAADWFYWWADVSVRGTVVMMAVLAIVYMTQRWTGPAWRFLACLFAIGGLALAPVTSVCGWRWEVLPADWQVIESMPSWSVVPLEWVFSVWVLGVGWFFGRLLLGYLNLWLLSATTPTVESVDLLTRVERLRQRIGLRRRIRILASSQRSVPMTWGVFRVHLLLPNEILDWPDDRLDAVILHEMAHIRRADCFWQWCSQTISCLFWFDPVVWLANRKMWHERERACDALAIGAGAVPTAYAEALLSVSRPARGSNQLLAVAMAGGGVLYRRLESILDQPAGRTRVSRFWLVAWSAVILLTALVQPREVTHSAKRVVADLQSTNPDEDQQPLAATQRPRGSTSFSSGHIRFDPRLRIIVSDNPSPSFPNELLFYDREIETDELLTASQHGPVVAIRLIDCPLGEGIWEAIGRLDSLRMLRLENVSQDSQHCLQVPSSVVELDLDRVEIGDWEQLTYLPHLTRLSIRDTELDETTLAVFARLPNLRQLSLAGTNVTRAGLEQIARSTSIEDLDLTGANFDRQTLVALGKMTSLRTIQLGCVDERVLQILSSLPNLQSIYVRNSVGEVVGPYSPHQWLKRIGERGSPCNCVDGKQTIVG
jgi:beta-lactamase regulating signal transducer with metallopeptidase domain